jgi:regulator of protease activity HflC (stomatin/prohibitin superfamily)
VKEQQVLEAAGEAEAIRIRAQAQAEAIATVAQALADSPSATEAAKLHVAREVRSSLNINIIYHMIILITC